MARPPTELLAAPDAARRLGVPYRTLMNWLTAERGPIRGEQDASGGWKIPAAEVERVAQSRAVKRADAQTWQLAAQLVREDVVRQRDANNEQIRAAAKRLGTLSPSGPAWEAATDEMRVLLAEDAALFNCALAVAERVQLEAYRRASALARRREGVPT